jgi:hypothetical protein
MPYDDFNEENNFGEEKCGSSKIKGTREHARPVIFCEDATFRGDVIIKGNVKIEGTLTVGGTIKAPYFDGIAKTAKSLQ